MFIRKGCVNSNNLASVTCLHIFKLIYLYQLLVNRFLMISCSNELELICLDTKIALVSTVKWLQLLLSNTNNSIQLKSFVCRQ